DSFNSIIGSASDSTRMNEDLTMLSEDFAPTVFHICGGNVEDVSKTMKWIQDLIVKEQTERTIKDSWISYFTQEDCAKLKELQQKLTVRIQLEIHNSDSVIKLEGLTRDVWTAEGQIKEMIMEVERLETRKREATLLSSLVEWQYDAGTSFLPVDILTNLTLEQAFDKHHSRVKICINNLEFQADLVTKKALRRNKIVCLKRSPAETLPHHWDDMKGTDPLVILLPTTSQEYQAVENEFRKTGLTNNITKIERIQNSLLWKSYQIKKSSMEEKNKHGNNERQLFHGTCTTTVDQINTHGFNRSYAGKNAAVIGNGTYFAVNPAYSAQNVYSKPGINREKNIYLAKVLVGDYTQGSPGLVVPPEKGTGNVADLYDSVVDNRNNPQVFVIFSDTQAYPEYLITFS
ncbi:poly ADP-ribose polymerase 14-like isoform X1, partial [Arapaima gigas]